jgi:hypothetical protein
LILHKKVDSSNVLGHLLAIAIENERPGSRGEIADFAGSDYGPWGGHLMGHPTRHNFNTAE